MSRTLTPERRRKMAAARARAEAARRRKQDRQYRLWQRWLRDETRAYSELVSARNSYGHSSIEADQAYKAWRTVTQAQPTVPPDAAFKRARGEGDNDSE